MVALPAQALADDGGGGSSASTLCAALSNATPQAIAALQGTPALASLLQGCGSTTGGDGGHSSDSGGGSSLCGALSNAAPQAIAALQGNPSLAAMLQGCGNSGQGEASTSTTCASMPAAAPGCATGGSQSFSDLGGYGWAQGAIAQLAQMQILHGIGGGRFDPGGTLTRAQFAALLQRVFNLQAPASGGTTFVDVPSGFWGASAIAAAAPYMTEYKLPGGTAFEPDLPATRIDVAASIGEIEVAQGTAQLPSASAAAAIWGAFSDGGTVPAGIAEAAAVAVQMGIMKGYPNGAFGVEDPISRAEAAVLLQRVLSSSETMGGGGSSTPQSGAPTITSVTPASGLSTGGTPIVIVGTGFVSGATVAVGGAAATSVVVVSPTLITAVTPPGTGTAPLTVTTSAGASPAGAQFTYSCVTVQTVSGAVYCGT